MTENERLTLKSVNGDVWLLDSEGKPYLLSVDGDDYNNALNRLADFEAIGTIEEFKALKEKSEPMPWVEEDMGEGETLWKCPDCNEYWALMEGTPKDNQYNFCPKCGRALKLSE